MALTAAQREVLIHRYEQGPVLLRDAFAQVPREAWKWRPAADKWSVYEIVCHCADSETNAAIRIRYLIAEDQPTILGYDQARWAKDLDYHGNAKIELALAAVDVMRAHTVNLLKHLPQSAWERAGTHTDSGRYSAEDWLTVYAEHLEKHSHQIERNLAAWRQEETSPGVKLLRVEESPS